MLYNKEFDEVMAKKELEIARIKEKNKRIRKILTDLGSTDPVYQPELSSIEKPEMLLVTEDSEVGRCELNIITVFYDRKLSRHRFQIVCKLASI